MRGSISNEHSAKMGGRFLPPSSYGTNMTLAETVEEAVYRVATIQAMSMEDLSVYFYSNEGQSEVKESIVIENEVVRSIAIVGFGKLLLLAWESSSKCDIEKFLRFSSLSEARRMKDDFMDFTSEMLGSFASGVVGRATASDPLQLLDDLPSCVGAYSEVLSALYQQFNSRIFEFNTAIDNMLGINDLETCRAKCSYDAISWLPFIRRVTGGLLCSGGHSLLIERWHQMSSCYEYSRLLSQLFLFLLGEGALDQNGEDGSVASAVLEWATLVKGRAGGDSFALVTPMLGSGSSGESHHTSVRVHRIAEEWICILQQQIASVSVYQAVAAVGEALSFCHVSCGLPEEVKSQVCVCVLKHAIRLLRISERMRFMRHKGAEDEETMDFLLNPSLRLHLMACVFYAARNPHRPFDSSSVDLCFLFETICSFSETDVTLTMLVTLGVSLLLYPPQPPFSSSFSSSTSFTSSIEHRLQLVFTHPFILSVLGPTPNKTQQTFRCRFIAALCIGIEKLIADTVNTVNSILNGNINILTESASNTLEVAAVDLMNLISCVPLIAESFGKCLYWGIEGFDGEAGPLSFVSLISCAVTVTLPPTISTPYYTSFPSTCSPSCLNWNNLQRLSTVQESNEASPTLQLLHAAFLELRIEIEKTLKSLFTLLRNGWDKKANDHFSIGASLELAYVLLLHHTQEQPVRGGAEEGGGTGSKAVNVNDGMLKSLAGILRDLLMGNVKPKGRGQGSSQVNAEGEGLVMADTALLPGGRTLGQHTLALTPATSATPSSTPASASSTATVADILEVLNVLEDLVVHADLAVGLMICNMVKDIAIPLNALGSVLHERVELLLLRLPGRNPHTLRRLRAPLQCSIVSISAEKRSSSSPQYLIGRSQGQGHGQGLGRGWGRREEDVVDVDEVMREKGDKGSKKGSGSKVNVSYVTTTSTFYQIFSVFDSHFPKGQEHLKGRNRGLMKSLTHGTPRDEHRGVYSVSDSSGSVSEEDVWVQVSGSGDLLTVLVTKSPAEIRASSQNSVLVPVRVSVTNSSGFKIPAFSIDMILLTADRCIASSPLSAHLASVLPSGSAGTLIGPDSLIEYLLPGSMVEKTFHILVRHVCSVDVVVRLCYPDLTEEEADSGDAFFTCPHTVKLGRGGGGRAGVVTADTDCAPYHIGVWSYLHPYSDAVTAFRKCDEGNPSSSSSTSSLRTLPSPSVNQIMRGASNAEQRMTLKSCHEGLSYDTFSSLWNSLPYSAVIHECYQLMSHGAEHGGQVNIRTGLYRVNLPASCTSSSSSSSLAWATSTLWGCSVAVRADSALTEEEEGTNGAGDPISHGQGVKMRMTVRCSSKETFKTIQANASSFLDAFL